MIWKFILFLVATSSWTLIGAAPSSQETQDGHGSLGDRIVLQINGTPYTQRQLEMYLLVKESLRSGQDASGKGTVALVTAANWKDALQAYTEDMLVEQESQRLGSFQPTDRMIELAGEMMKKVLTNDKKAGEKAAQLGLSGKTTIRTLSSVLRTDAFRRSKDKQSAGGAGENSQEGTTDENKGLWLDNIKSRSIVRRFEGAETWQPLMPFGVAAPSVKKK